jgi:hypothetical protein
VLLGIALPTIDETEHWRRFSTRRPSWKCCRRATRSASRVRHQWHNFNHHHVGLARLTPAQVHYGRVERRVAQNQVTLNLAYDANPERFVRGRPIAAGPPRESG